MAKILDRLLLFIYSLSIGILSVVAILLLSGAMPYEISLQEEQNLWIAAIVVAAVLFILSLRFFYISVRRDRASLPSIDQRTEFGDIQISMETVENLCLKAASKFRGLRDVKARVRVVESGLEILIRAVVDGEGSIPSLTSDVQKGVHDYVGEITGIPVSDVSVYIANLAQSPSFKSRVE
ncbi:alkaline shock response membrane anchor protein AmaP [Paenibacillus sp. JX-17]|uniref:Alkaline shock response membrane anchor protein AmaP n=1 Tax=Paenibacillus lacisoli TaxID=3064525 RepID=A0ABT9C7C0_9BACL|nr:alkaline shock response membrane anchor protein AmaP [Paenibacillus sp. JX-17]MDO7905164.1 alkaline shock response membrane anchor protein AmaP [Paenibacillus sp. JX-17]